MRLSFKIASAMTLLITLMVVALGLASIRREASLLEADIARDSRLIAESLASLLEHSATPLSNHEEWTSILAAVDREEGEILIAWRDVSAADFGQLPPNTIANLRGGRVTVSRDDSGFRAIAPVFEGAELAGGVEVFESMELRDSFVRRALTTNGITVVLVVLLSAVLALALGRWLVGSPVEHLVRRARQIGRGEVVADPISGSDELALLDAELSSMASELDSRQRLAEEQADARLRAEQQLRHADRLTTVGHLAAGMAHELGTPLNVIAGRAALITQHSLAETPASSNAEIIREQAARITRIVQRMLRFSRRAEPAREWCDLHQVILDSAALVATAARKAKVDMDLEDLGDGELRVHVDVGQLEQVFANLFMNGIHAIRDGGALRVVVRPLGTPGESLIQIEVSDTGCGIAASNLPRVFDPFFTTKEPGEGTGLGLSVVHGIVADHQGTITVESTEGVGTTFTIQLPMEAPR